jgi:hypothetical protein
MIVDCLWGSSQDYGHVRSLSVCGKPAGIPRLKRSERAINGSLRERTNCHRKSQVRPPKGRGYTAVAVWFMPPPGHVRLYGSWKPAKVRPVSFNCQLRLAAVPWPLRHLRKRILSLRSLAEQLRALY